jgi:hypothetical protein
VRFEVRGSREEVREKNEGRREKRATALHPNYVGVIERGGNTPSLQSFITISARPRP